MKLIKNFFIAKDRFENRLFISYFKQIITTYIEEFSSKYDKQSKLNNIWQIFDSKIISEDKSKITYQDLNYINDTESNVESFEKEFKIDLEDVKLLDEIFIKMGSQNIKQLLMLLEHKQINYRKLALVLFQILLRNPQSKLHFVEKCALGSSEGIYLLSRLKWVSLLPNDSTNTFSLMMKIKKCINDLKFEMDLKKSNCKGKFN